MRIHYAWLMAALGLTCAVYARLLPTYFCGYDDFTNAHRAILEDADNPDRIFTNTHFGSPKYRPLSRAITYASQTMDWPPVLAHRLRNLFCHLVAVALVYALTMQLSGASEVAFAAAALFGVHPMSHQTVAAAIFTNSFAYAAMLLSLALFQRAYRSESHPMLLLVGSLTASGVALFTYESTVVVFGCFLLYLLMKRAEVDAPATGQRRFLVGLAAGSFAVLGAFAIGRALVVTGHMPRTPPATIVLNLALFTGSLGLPVDLLLLNSLWGTPLPSEIVGNHTALLVLTGTLLLVVALPLAWLSQQAWFRQRARDLRLLPIGYVSAGIPLALAPFLLFSDHPSETYLYLPTAFFAIAVSLCLHGFARQRRSFLALASFAILLAASATSMRTERVRQCGIEAARVLKELPLDRWRSGEWNVVLADAPGTPTLRRFGLYGYRGLATIDPRQPGVRALEAALQLETRNPSLRAEAVPTDQLTAACSEFTFCAWVHDDGRVAAAR